MATYTVFCPSQHSDTQESVQPVEEIPLSRRRPLRVFLVDTKQWLYNWPNITDLILRQYEMPLKLTQQQLEAQLWGATNILRSKTAE